MAGLFSTEDVGEAQASPITAKSAPAPDKSAAQLIETVGGFAWEAAKEKTVQTALSKQEVGLDIAQDERNARLGEMKLKVLNDKFDVLSEGQMQGLPTSQANARARALLAEAKAAAPWIGDRADEAFKSYFGGSDKGFEKSALEKAAEATQEEIANTAAMMGVSLRQAQAVVQLRERNKANKEILTKREIDQTNAKPAVRAYANSSLQDSTMQISAISQGLLDASGGTTFKPEALGTVKNAIKTMANKMRFDYRDSVMPKGKLPLLSEADFKEGMAAFDDWEKQQLSLVDERSYASLVKATKEVQDAEFGVSANLLMPAVRILESAGGQAPVEAYFKGLTSPTYVPTLTARIPTLKAFFDEAGNAKKVTAASLSKAMGFNFGEIIAPEVSTAAWAGSAMQNGGAAASQAMLAEPHNAAVATAAYNQVLSENPKEAEVATSYHKEAGMIVPSETARTLVGQSFRNYVAQHKDEGFKVIASSLEGMSQAFRVTYFNAGEAFPDYVEVVPNFEADLSAIDKSKASFKVGTSDGRLVPEAAKNTLAQQYRVLNAHPEYVAEFSKMMGIPLNSAEVLEIMVNGKLAPKFILRAEKQMSEGSFEVPVSPRGATSLLKGLSSSLSVKVNPKQSAMGTVLGGAERSVTIPPEASQLTPEEMAAEPTPSLHPEDAAYIKAGKTAEEKARRAKALGVDPEIVDKLLRK